MREPRKGGSFPPKGRARGVGVRPPPPQALAVGFLFWWRCFFISGGSLWFFKSRPSVQSLDVTSEQTVFSYLYQL